ncbi:MAG: hypothetical protein LIO96_06160 [Lachnospiraceae bacterium]|nr:hypothetical protein [Lachnospiraceae bacterium]
MEIRVLDKHYEVIQRIRSTGSLNVYVARDCNLSEGDLCTVACVRDEALIRDLIPVTTVNNTSRSFKDLRESFIADGRYYIVLRYVEGEHFSEAVKKHDWNLEERLLLVKNLFFRILTMNMPTCFIYEALRRDSIVVDAAMGVSFRYCFVEADSYGKVTEADCMKRVGDLLLELFEKELKEKSSPELTRFFRDMERGKFEALWDYYVAFDEIYDQIRQKNANNEIKPRRLRQKIQERFQKVFPVIKTVLTVALIAAAGIYLLWSLPNPAISDDGSTFSKIGTLNIVEQQE